MKIQMQSVQSLFIRVTDLEQLFSKFPNIFQPYSILNFAKNLQVWVSSPSKFHPLGGVDSSFIHWRNARKVKGADQPDIPDTPTSLDSPRITRT